MTNNLADDAQAFLRAKLSFAYSPSNPILSDDWAAVAFDRNIHDSLAPDYFWDAFLRSVSVCGDVLITLADASIVEQGESARVVMLPAKRSRLISTLLDGERFLRDQVLFGPSKRWACLLDQDVTLFSGDAGIVAGAICFAGGPARIEQQMYSDFGVEQGSDTPLNGYLGRLISGWRRAGLTW